MPVWEPTADEKIGPREMLGRRIFTEELWEKKAGVGWFRMDHFYERTLADDLSVDRLGQTGVDNSIKRRLSRSAHDEADRRTPPRPFTGWATCGHQHLAGLGCEVAPKPLADGTNPYHAEICRDRYRQDKQGAYAFATMMRDLFSKNGSFHEAVARPTPRPAAVTNPSTTT